MAAFRAAIAAGHGIECDVRESADGRAIVFHDADLRRMTGRPERVDALPSAVLTSISLPDGGGIVRLDQLLALCGPDTPLLIEIKTRKLRVGTLCPAVARDLTAHPAARVGVMAFSPIVLFWFRRHRPHVPRGLVVSQQGKSRWQGAAERALALWLAKPDFLACDICDLPTPFAARARSKGMPVLSWTVRSPAEHARARAYADQIIFEDAGALHG